MKAYFRTWLIPCLLAPILGSAQEEHRVRIEREHTVNGNTEHQVWEFTAPSEEALADSLMAMGSDLRQGSKPLLGVGLQDLSDEVDGIGGVLVVHVAPGSPAALAGLRPGDRIMAVDGQRTDGPGDVIGLVQGHRPGDRLKLAYMRGDDPRESEVTLARQPEPDGKASRKWPYRGWSFDAEEWPSLTEQAYLGVGPAEAQDGHGAVVGRVGPGSPAEQMGLQPGDRITALNDVAIAGFNDLTGAVSDLKPGEPVTLSVERGGKRMKLKGTLGSRQGVLSWPGFGDSMSGGSLDGWLFEQFEELGRQMEQLWQRLEQGGTGTQEGPGRLQ